MASRLATAIAEPGRRRTLLVTHTRTHEVISTSSLRLVEIARKFTMKDKPPILPPPSSIQGGVR